MLESNMRENWDDCFDMVIKSEGGFVNNSRDPGGMTNLGVTRSVWQAYLKRDVTEADMRALTPQMVKPFYKALYWDRIKGDSLPSGVDYAAYDLAVNSGPHRAAQYLQQIAGVTVDGMIGPKSLEAINTCDAKEAADAICDMRMDFLKKLPTFDTFGKGWSRRVEEVKAKAVSMADEA
jgi:lysozyme family protein